MTREEARVILGNQPKWMLRNMALALTLSPWRNTDEDNRRLMALKVLGYGVRVKSHRQKKEDNDGREFD